MLQFTRASLIATAARLMALCTGRLTANFVKVFEIYYHIAKTILGVNIHPYPFIAENEALSICLSTLRSFVNRSVT